MSNYILESRYGEFTTLLGATRYGATVTGAFKNLGRVLLIFIPVKALRFLCQEGVRMRRTCLW